MSRVSEVLRDDRFETLLIDSQRKTALRLLKAAYLSSMTTRSWHEETRTFLKRMGQL